MCEGHGSSSCSLCSQNKCYKSFSNESTCVVQELMVHKAPTYMSFRNVYCANSEGLEEVRAKNAKNRVSQLVLLPI